MRRLLSALFVLSATALALPSVAAERPTEPFRKEHVQIQAHLGHLHDWVGALASQPAAEQRPTMERVVKFLTEHILTHAQWEERALYPAVDKRAGRPDAPFTSTMRHEHKIIERRIGQLRGMTVAKSVPVKDFTRSADALLGIIAAHFEKEEEVLLAVLDKSMTPEEFRTEILAAGDAHGTQAAPAKPAAPDHGHGKAGK